MAFTHGQAPAGKFGERLNFNGHIPPFLFVFPYAGYATIHQECRRDPALRPVNPLPVRRI
jgi:hypothetical protein